ncbi:unnamed protein product [Cuscuta campestris]|uniref:Secreted protein n=1 Tax=Cuscuta campestris TaxID=132261 RepID=A0A484KI30_9ASTE|nr:unnamed protein product [Cuscuta campestris]
MCPFWTLLILGYLEGSDQHMAGQSGMTQLLQPQQLKCPVVHYEAFCEISKRNEFQGWLLPLFGFLFSQ